jgi:predicted acyl esterase
MSVLNLGGKDIVNRPETSFPLEREVPFKLYLHPDTRTLSETQPSAQTEVSYDAVTGDVVFSWPIQETVEFTGYISLRLWASTKGSNDMDIFARLRKINATTRKTLESVLVDVGRLAPHPEKERQELLSKHATNPGFGAAFFNSGPIGCLRASHRALDLEKSTSLRPVYTHKEEQLLQDGEVVPLDIAIWPYGMICNSGEELQLIISGYHPEPHCRPNDPLPELRNKGVHTILAGGEYDSYLLLPLIPSKKA